MVKERLDPYREPSLLIRSYHFRRYQLAKDYISTQKHFSVLDVGCGTGFGMHLLKNNLEIVGMDYNIGAMRYGKKHYKHGKCSFITSDAHFLPFKDSTFDCVICLEVIEHVKNPYLVMLEIRRVLKMGGRLILSTPNAEKPTGNPFHVKEFSYSDLREFINSFCFNIEVSRGILLKNGFRIYYILDNLLRRVNHQLDSSKIAYILRFWLVELLVRTSSLFPRYSYFAFLISRKS